MIGEATELVTLATSNGTASQFYYSSISFAAFHSTSFSAGLCLLLGTRQAINKLGKVREQSFVTAT